MVTRRTLGIVLGGVCVPAVSGCLSGDRNQGVPPSEYVSYIEVRIYDNDPEGDNFVPSTHDAIENVPIFQDIFETATEDYPDEMAESRSVYHDQPFLFEEYDIVDYSDSEIETATVAFRELPRSEPDGFPSGVYVEHEQCILHVYPIIED